MYRILRKIGFYNNAEIKGRSKKHNQKYHTPEKIGEKWQIDVKYVPMECKVKGLPKEIKYYKYKAKEIQTDNGIEFTYNQAEIKKEHPMDTLLNSLKIKHHKIRPRTPEHNGKVERSHRNDNERFYSWLTFYSLEDLRKQGATYLKRSNRIPMAVLGYLTPKEKRVELMCA